MRYWQSVYQQWSVTSRAATGDANRLKQNRTVLSDRSIVNRSGLQLRCRKCHVREYNRQRTSIVNLSDSCTTAAEVPRRSSIDLIRSGKTPNKYANPTYATGSLILYFTVSARWRRQPAPAPSSVVGMLLAAESDR